MYMSEKSNDNSKEISRNIELVTKCDLWKSKYDSENFQVSIPIGIWLCKFSANLV